MTQKQPTMKQRRSRIRQRRRRKLQSSAKVTREQRKIGKIQESVPSREVTHTGGNTPKRSIQATKTTRRWAHEKIAQLEAGTWEARVRYTDQESPYNQEIIPDIEQERGRKTNTVVCINRESPLSEGLQMSPYPPQFIMVPVPKFKGDLDPRQCLTAYEATMTLAGGDDIAPAKALACALEGLALTPVLQTHREVHVQLGKPKG